MSYANAKRRKGNPVVKLVPLSLLSSILKRPTKLIFPPGSTEEHKTHDVNSTGFLTRLRLDGTKARKCRGHMCCIILDRLLFNVGSLLPNHLPAKPQGFPSWIYSSTLAYMVDANVGRSSTAVASNSFVRGFAGFVAAEIAVPLQVSQSPSVAILS